MSATLAPHTAASSVAVPTHILDPGLCLTLRPMRFPVFYDMFRDGIKNTWTVEEVDFQTDLVDLKQRITPAEVHVIQRLVAFFATGDSIVSNNLVLNLYKHINSPEARLYLSRQLFEEAVHVQFYLTLLDNYVPRPRGARSCVRCGRKHSFDFEEGRLLHEVDGFHPAARIRLRRASIEGSSF
jgi:ribonucleoside-diphosphate reductase beta chain